jgi:hypothetical protein
MTEAEWLNSQNQLDLLKFIRGQASERKLRLFACAAIRREWEWLIRKRNRSAVEVAERFADGLAPQSEMKKARGRAFDKYESWGERFNTLRNANITYALQNSVAVGSDDAWTAAKSVTATACNRDECDLLRCIFGNPFRPVCLDPAWRTPTAIDLALAAYTERLLPSGNLEPARLLVVADALEDAGCTDAVHLGHLRGPGPHARGCWPVDLLLGKD